MMSYSESFSHLLARIIIKCLPDRITYCEFVNPSARTHKHNVTDFKSLTVVL